MKLTTVISAFAISALMMGGVAYAVEAAPAAKPAAAAPMAAAPMAAKPARSEKSIQCSKDADAKGLHGKERKKFERECKNAK